MSTEAATCRRVRTIDVLERVEGTPASHHARPGAFTAARLNIEHISHTLCESFSCISVAYMCVIKQVW